MYIMLCERAIGSTCGVHELTYGQFFNLNLINYIQISNFIFFCGVHKVTYQEIYICLCYKTISQFKFNMLYSELGYKTGLDRTFNRSPCSTLVL
jgi:hypothetical protein